MVAAYAHSMTIRYVVKKSFLAPHVHHRDRKRSA
jgi:hypothetical protein